MIQIVELTPHGEKVESNLESAAAAKRRLNMLQRHNPHTTYWIDYPKPKVTVTRLTSIAPKFTVSRIA